MRLGKMSYPELIDEILYIFKAVFGDEMIFIERKEAFHHMGYFRIEYQYLPLSYGIVFESERDVFLIDIFDEEGAKSTLRGIEKFYNETNEENIQTAVKLLKEALKKNDFYFYIRKNSKMYKKKKQEYKRIRSITELTEK